MYSPSRTRERTYTQSSYQLLGLRLPWYRDPPKCYAWLRLPYINPNRPAAVSLERRQFPGVKRSLMTPRIRGRLACLAARGAEITPSQFSEKLMKIESIIFANIVEKSLFTTVYMKLCLTYPGIFCAIFFSFVQALRESQALLSFLFSLVKFMRRKSLFFMQIVNKSFFTTLYCKVFFIHLIYLFIFFLSFVHTHYLRNDTGKSAFLFQLQTLQKQIFLLLLFCFL